MPNRIDTWECKACGKVYAEEGHAKVCEDSHVKRKDLHILNTHPIPSTSFIYHEGQELPATLVVGDKFGKSGIYVLRQDTGSGQSNATRPLRRGAMRLRP